MARKRDIEIRGVPSGTVFLGTINTFHGLWLKDACGVVALDVPSLSNEMISTLQKRSAAWHRFADCTPIINYDGPLDVQIKVKRYSPWRGHQKPVSQIEVAYQREPDLRKGPRKVRLRQEAEPTADAEVE